MKLLRTLRSLLPAHSVIRIVLPLLALAALVAPARAQSYNYQTLDDPAADNFTAAVGISGGNIVGFYLGANDFDDHGFLYNLATQSYTTLDNPNAASDTVASGISGGNIVGYYIDANNDDHGFLYNLATQSYTTLDDPNADGVTEAVSIDGGNITGYYTDANNDTHGFLYNLTTQSYTTLDDPNANNYTVAAGISGGNIVGYYTDANKDNHGYIYNLATQSYTTFDDPGASGNTYAFGISGGNIVGYYSDANNDYHGFLYNLATQSYTTFDDPSANGATVTFGIDGSNIVGYYAVNNDAHGFLATPQGPVAPAITTQPDNQTIFAGHPVTFTVAAIGFPAPSLQWQISTNNGVAWANLIDGGNIIGSASTSLTLSNTTIAMSGNQFRAVATNSVNSAISHVVTLVVTAPLYDFSSLDDPNADGTTAASGISGGNLVGFYVDASHETHGFLYNLATQSYTTLDDPNTAGATVANGATAAYGISGGNLVGNYTDANNLTHGFLYNLATQSYTTLDDPNANGVTTAYDISGGNIVGSYEDASQNTHGFLYNLATQSYTTLDDPNADSNTEAYGIDGGNIVGEYLDASSNYHGFLYNLATQSYTTLDDPNAVGVTGANGISGGNLVGFYLDSDGIYHGFLYNLTTQSYTTFDDPGANGYSESSGIDGGNIVGEYLGMDGSFHGFLATLKPTPPVISPPLVNSTAILGTAASFTVSATGSGNLTYQWQFNGKPISGATNATYTIAKVAKTNFGNYSVFISNFVGNITSTPFTFTLAAAPKITTSPKALTLAYGATGNFTVVATGNPAPTFLWHLNNAPITASNVSGINGPKLTFTAAIPANAGSYTVTVSNNYGSVTSKIAKLTVKITAPRITKQPVAPKTAPAPGANVNFTVTATGSNTPLLYQWTFKSGTSPAANVTFNNATGTQSAELSLTSITTANAGTYQVIVSNTAGSAKSTAVKLTVK